MIIHNLHVVRASIYPAKADSPLTIDANTMLAGPIALQGFQPISGPRA
jgi:hypothetical protein